MRVLLLVLAFAIHNQAYSQKYISKTSRVTFFSEAPLENIEAVNNKATSIFDLSTGEIVFSVPIREFQFQKSLMKKHFNENYMDSEKYPKSTFKGRVSGYQLTDGKFKSKAIGELTIHGKTKRIEVNGEVRKNGEDMILQATFNIALEDYDIKIPRILFSNIAESVEVSIEFTYISYATN